MEKEELIGEGYVQMFVTFSDKSVAPSICSMPGRPQPKHSLTMKIVSHVY
jgi:hypothetical protein